MTLGPSSEEQSLTMARRAIDDALFALSVWCPHGMDSARVSDYHAADEAREHLEAAALALRVGRPW